jgi:hypothetical protein
MGQTQLETNRQRIEKNLLAGGVTERGHLVEFDKVTGFDDIGPKLAKQLVKDLTTLTPAEWAVAYPRIKPTRQMQHTNHTNDELERLFVE